MDQLRTISVWIVLDCISGSLAQTLVGHWPLDVTSGMNDISGNNFHLTPNFSPITYISDHSGNTNGATVFNTAGVTTLSPDMSPVIHPLTSLTITAWVRHQSSSTDGYPFRLVDNSGNKLFHIKTALTTIYFAGKSYDGVSHSFPVGAWYYLVVKFDGATTKARIWVDGVELIFTAKTNAIGSSWITGNGAKVIIGQPVLTCTSACAFNAAISDVRFYAEVAAGVEDPSYAPPQPTTQQPTTEQPTTEQPTTEQPTTVPVPVADDILYFESLRSFWSNIQCVAECHRMGTCVNVTLSQDAGDLLLCSGYYRLDADREQMVSSHICRTPCALCHGEWLTTADHQCGLQ